MAVALMKQGKRVGVTSLSHKAIHNMLRAIQHEAGVEMFALEPFAQALSDSTSLPPPGDGIREDKDGLLHLLGIIAGR